MDVIDKENGCFEWESGILKVDSYVNQIITPPDTFISGHHSCSCRGLGFSSLEPSHLTMLQPTWTPTNLSSNLLVLQPTCALTYLNSNLLELQPIWIPTYLNSNLFGSVKRYFMIDCWLIIGQHTKIHIFHLYPTSLALAVKKMWEVGWFLRKQAILGTSFV